MLTKEELEKLGKVFVYRGTDSGAHVSWVGSVGHLENTYINVSGIIAKMKQGVIYEDYNKDTWTLDYNWLYKSDPRYKYAKYFDAISEDIGAIKCGDQGDIDVEKCDTVSSVVKKIAKQMRDEMVDMSASLNREINNQKDKEWSASHYDYTYQHPVTKGDADVGYVKINIDPYFVNKVWNLNSKDDTGCLFHSLKTIARFRNKHTVQRELEALNAQIKRMAELYGVEL